MNVFTLNLNLESARFLQEVLSKTTVQRKGARMLADLADAVDEAVQVLSENKPKPS